MEHKGEGERGSGESLTPRSKSELAPAMAELGNALRVCREMNGTGEGERGEGFGSLDYGLSCGDEIPKFFKWVLGTEATEGPVLKQQG